MNSNANAICGRLGELNVKKMGKTSLMRIQFVCINR